jgi:hypothetical protein
VVPAYRSDVAAVPVDMPGRVLVADAVQARCLYGAAKGRYWPRSPLVHTGRVSLGTLEYPEIPLGRRTLPAVTTVTG